MPEGAIYLIAGGRGAGGRGAGWSGGRGLRQILESTGTPRPRIAYVGAASGDDPAVLLSNRRLLTRAGAGGVALAPLCGRRGSLERALPVLEQADVIFISGGDVEAGMRVLRESRALPHLARLHKAGKPFIGVSAGSIMLTRQWVRWDDPSDDSTAETFRCLGLAPVLCDTHGEREDWEELKALLALCPIGSTGYGIATGSALAVSGSTVTRVGRGEVHVFKRTKRGVVQKENLD